MKTLDVKKITETIRRMTVEVNTDLPKDVEQALVEGRAKEESPFGQYCLDQILANATLARCEKQAMCQDTGTMVVYLNIGQDLHLVGGDLTEAVHEGVRLGYDEGYLRRSMVEEPVFDRINTGDNTPAVIHINIVPGDQLELTLMPKGGGAENMGALGMLKPTAGKDGVVDFVVDAVSRAGGNPCPPIIVGVGIGGTMEKATEIAKEALARPIGSHHADPRYADMEAEILEKVNKLGIGPQGLGGRVTALAVHVNTHPCHIASLPVAVNINCHAARHMSTVLEGEEM
ncbi:MAG: fumarate hydratase [Peptococcaceae bacterium]|jgi:fumarate hydratase subunit alpha